MWGGFFLHGSEVFSHLQTGTRSLLIVFLFPPLPAGQSLLSHFLLLLLPFIRSSLLCRLLSPWLPCCCWDHTSVPLNKVICCFVRDVVRWGTCNPGSLRPGLYVICYVGMLTCFLTPAPRDEDSSVTVSQAVGGVSM